MILNIDFFRAYVMGQFHALLEYHRHSEAQMQESHHTMRSQIVHLAKPPRESSDDAVQEWMAAARSELDACDRRFAVEFSRLHRYSVLLMLGTLAETLLLRVTNEIIERRGLALNRVPSTGMWEELLRRFNEA